MIGSLLTDNRRLWKYRTQFRLC